MLQQGFGLEAFKAAMRIEVAGLSETQQIMLRLAVRYKGLLDAFGMCERSEAMALLLEHEEIEWPVIACEGIASLSLSEASFFAGLSKLTDAVFAIDVPACSDFVADELLLKGLEDFGADVVRGHFAAHAASGGGAELKQLVRSLYVDSDAEAIEPTGALCLRNGEPPLKAATGIFSTAAKALYG